MLDPWREIRYQFFDNCASKSPHSSSDGTGDYTQCAAGTHSGTHLERVATEEAVDAVQVDDESHAFTILVQIALGLGRVVVHVAAHGLGGFHSAAAPERYKRF